MKQHLDSNVKFHGEKLGVIQFKKFFSWYTRGLAAKDLKVNTFIADTRDEMMKLIYELERVAGEGLHPESKYQYVS